MPRLQAKNNKRHLLASTSIVSCQGQFFRYAGRMGAIENLVRPMPLLYSLTPKDRILRQTRLKHGSKQRYSIVRPSDFGFIERDRRHGNVRTRDSFDTG